MGKQWKEFTTLDESLEAWDTRAESARKEHPLKVLKNLPDIPGITKETAKNLTWKSLKWMIIKDKGMKVFGHVAKRPFHYLFGYLRSLFKKKPYIRDDDFFLYGIDNVEEFKKLLEEPDSILMVGFSYCEKPHECPSGRFNDNCIHDITNPVCQQCFIGKAIHALPEERTVPLLIPTIHYIAKKVFEVVEANPNKKVLFLITACEMTLEMFGDWGNMSGIRGIGVRLDGRICNTMRAFELSEEGIKPGLTVVLGKTQDRILELLRHWFQQNEKV